MRCLSKSQKPDVRLKKVRRAKSLCFRNGSKKNADRMGMTHPIQFGSEDYSKEVLVTELGAAMLCGGTGIENTTLGISASYIQSRLRALKNDKTLIVKASQKTSDHILGLQ